MMSIASVIFHGSRGENGSSTGIHSARSMNSFASPAGQSPIRHIPIAAATAIAPCDAAFP